MKRLKITAGELRCRVAVLAYSETPSGNSDVTTTLDPIAHCWAKFSPVKGLTYFDTKQIGEAVTHEVTIRYYEGVTITSENWLLYGGRYFRIRAIRNVDERNRVLELTCEEDHKVVP